MLLCLSRIAMSSEGVGEDCLAWAARDASGVLSPYKFNRRYVCYMYLSFHFVEWSNSFRI